MTIEDKKIVISVLNTITNNLVDYCLDPNTIVEMHKKYQHNKIDSLLSKNSADNGSIDHIIDEIETYPKYKKESQPKETFAERVKLMPVKRKTQKLGTGLKILTSNILLTRLPVLLAQTKAGNNSYKIENEIRQILYLCINIIKSPKSFTTI